MTKLVWAWRTGRKNSMQLDCFWDDGLVADWWVFGIWEIRITWWSNDFCHWGTKIFFFPKCHSIHHKLSRFVAGHGPLKLNIIIVQQCSLHRQSNGCAALENMQHRFVAISMPLVTKRVLPPTTFSPTFPTIAATVIFSNLCSSLPFGDLPGDPRCDFTLVNCQPHHIL